MDPIGRHDAYLVQGEAGPGSVAPDIAVGARRTRKRPDRALVSRDRCGRLPAVDDASAEPGGVAADAASIPGLRGANSGHAGGEQDGDEKSFHGFLRVACQTRASAGANDTRSKPIIQACATSVPALITKYVSTLELSHCAVARLGIDPLPGQ